MSRNAQVLSRVSLRNFKSIREATIDLRQLTILVGENSAGKSSLIQSIFLLAQIARGRNRPDQVSLNGLELSLGNFSDVLHNDAPEQEIDISLTVPARSARFRRPPRTVGRTRQARLANRPTGADDLESEAEWQLTLGHPQDGLGVARVTRAAIRDFRSCTQLEVRPAHDYQVVEEAFQHARELGLTRRGFAAGRFQSQVRETSPHFEGDLEVDEDAFGEEVSRTFPAVALDNGLPVELFTLEEDSLALARRWLSLKLTRTLHERGERGYEPSLRDLRSERLRDEMGEMDVESAAEVLFGDFRLWVDELDQNIEPSQALRHVEPMSPDLFITARVNEEELQLALGARLEDQRPGRSVVEPTWSSSLEVASGFRELLHRSIHYLGPLREDPRPSYRPGQAGAGIATLGIKGEYTVAALNLYESQRTMCPQADGGRARPMALRDAVNYWADKFGLASAVETKDMGRSGIELELTDSQTNFSRDLTSVGVGVSQLLPVIVLCLLAEPGELVLLEQPELHLHPAPQQILGDFLIGIAASGRQLIVESHSEYLVNRLRLRIAQDDENEVGPLVKLWYARRNAGQTSFEALEPNRYGSFDDWPAGFFDQAADDAEQILRESARKRRAERQTAPQQRTRRVGTAPAPKPRPQPVDEPGAVTVIRELIENEAPRDEARYQLDYIRRAAEELDLEARLPSGSRKYVNLYPPAAFGRKRASAFQPSSGRLEIYCSPDRAADHPDAAVVTHRGEPHAVKIYLRSAGAVDQALSLTRLGLEERLAGH